MEGRPRVLPMSLQGEEGGLSPPCSDTISSGYHNLRFYSHFFLKPKMSNIWVDKPIQFTLSGCVITAFSLPLPRSIFLLPGTGPLKTLSQWFRVLKRQITIEPNRSLQYFPQDRRFQLLATAPQRGGLCSRAWAGPWDHLS